MLIEFRVENHRSLRDEQGITFEASGDRKDARVRHIGKHDLLPVAAIYGANASGKSNVLTALKWMRDAVVDSFTWSPHGGVPGQPWAWGEARQRPSTFEAVFLIDGVHHTYGFIVDDKLVLEEWLWVRPHGRKQVWFERKGQDFTFGEQLKGENEVVRGVTRHNGLFLGVAALMNHPQLSAVHRFFSTMEFASHVAAKSWHDDIPGFLDDMDLALRPDGLASLVPLLRAADVGIEDIRFGDEGIELRHKTDTDEPAWLLLEEESHGTKRLLELGRSLQRVKSVLIIDEIEAGLHPLLVRTVLDQFQKPELNPKNAQLLFTTHDTLLLGTLLDDGPLLRRDQVWLTEKGPSGASDVVPLSVYSPRKGENLERAYLQGRYRAVPLINRSRFGVG